MATRVVVSISAMSTKKESQASFENKWFSEIILEQCYPNMSIRDVQGCYFWAWGHLKEKPTMQRKEKAREL